MAARTAVVAGTATAVSGGVQRRQQERAQREDDSQQQAAAQPPAPAPAAPASGGTDLVAELQKLASLKDAGVLSDGEFAAAKAKLLG